MERINVGLGDRSYPIWVGDGILESLGDALEAVSFPRRIALVTNETVSPLYGDRVEALLSRVGYQVLPVVLPDGEEYKTLSTVEKIFDALLENGFDRSSGLLALGGGVVGDMCGFAAATYMRGIPFVQVPTTLLSQVDSSVGGKTGVNHLLGKNMIGAFYQPRHVHIDVSTLSTLPQREFSAGMAEVVKYGIIRDADFFTWIRNNTDILRSRDARSLIHCVVRSCQIKANVVENDERESSLRAILNYGHTFGHAIEALAGYGEFLHGEAVAIGMAFAAVLSREMGLCRDDEVGMIIELLASIGLPVLPPAFPLGEYLDVMSRDKKTRDGVLRFVLNHGIGDCVIKDIAEPSLLVQRVLETMRQKRS